MKFFWVCVSFLILIPSNVPLHFEEVIDNPSTQTAPYEEHPPIKIISNENFTPENGVRYGNGTPENPYVIEFWFFNLSDDAIFIASTTAHFIIKNCKIISKLFGIYLQNVSNASIVSCEIYSHSWGIWVGVSRNSTIRNNTIHPFFGVDERIQSLGIQIRECSNITVERNTIENMDSYGIVVESSINITIRLNRFREDSLSTSAFIFLERAQNCTVELNYPLRAIWTTFIILREAHNNTIVNNTYSAHESRWGIDASSSNNNIIANNIFGYLEGGIRLTQCSGNILYKNCFVYCEMSINIESVNSLNNFIFSNIFFYYTPNIYDEGRNYWNNSTTGNFWCDHVLPDNNSDGIVDVPQPIYGNGNIVNYDYFPVVNLPGSFIVPHTYPYMCMEEVRTDVVTVRNISKASVFYRTSTEEDYQCAEMEICFWSSNLKSYRWKIVVWDLPTPYPGFPMYYFFWVIDDCGNTLISPECYTDAVLSRSSPPTNLTLTVSATKIFLSWEPPGDIGGAYLREYKIYRGDSLFNKSIVASVDANTTTYVDSNVTPGITYYYHITAVNAIGESEPSNTVSATPGSAPSPPQNLTAEVKQRSVALAWNLPVDAGALPLTAYNIYRGLSMENKTLLATVDANTTTYVDNSVIPGLTYYYHVTAVNAIGESEPSNTVSVTVPAKLFAKILVPKTTLCSGEEILLSVLVTYADGGGVENTTVSLSTQLPGRFESETGQTDANGTFTTKFVAGNVNSSVFGKVVATVSAEGYENATASILLGILAKEMRITVEVDKPEVRVGENFTVVVWVKDENGKGIENASVEILPGPNGAFAGGKGVTDTEGKAVLTFSALKEGNVVLQVIANKEGFAEARAGVGLAIKPMPEQKIDFAIPLGLLLIILLCIGIWVERRVSERQRE